MPTKRAPHEKIKIPTYLPYRLTREQGDRVLKEIGDDVRDRALFLLWVASGCSPSLLHGLTSGDARELLARKAIAVPLGAGTRRVHDNPLADETVRALRALLRRLEAEGRAGDDDPLFLTRGSGHRVSEFMTRTSIVSFVTNLFTRAGVKRTPMTKTEYLEAYHRWRRLVKRARSATAEEIARWKERRARTPSLEKKARAL